MLPRQAASLSTATQPFAPKGIYAVPELPQPSIVAGDAIVRVMPLKLQVQSTLLLLKGQVPMRSAP